VTTDNVKLELIVPETLRTSTLKDIEQGGGVVEISDERFRSETAGPAFEPLIIIACVVYFGYLVRLVQKVWQDSK